MGKKCDKLHTVTGGVETPEFLGCTVSYNEGARDWSANVCTLGALTRQLLTLLQYIVDVGPLSNHVCSLSKVVHPVTMDKKNC